MPRVYHCAAAPLVAAREDLGADHDQIEASIELQRDCVVRNDARDMLCVDRECIKDRVIITEVQDGPGREVRELIDHCLEIAPTRAQCPPTRTMVGRKRDGTDCQLRNFCETGRRCRWCLTC